MQQTDTVNEAPAQMATGIAATHWAALPDVSDVQPLSAGDRAMFDEIREVLQRHQALQRFGLNLLHRHFNLEDGECILETTDTTQRRQLIEVRKLSELAGQRVIETQWVFDGGGTLYCVGFCNYNQGHRHLHNKS